MASYSSPPKWSVYSRVGTVQKPPHHTLGGNLLRDIVDIPKGIPAGIAMLVRHPVGTGKAMFSQTKETYSPLWHGQFGKFYGNFHAHPLQPILDAVSVATLAAGGIGAGIKAADTVINTGRAVEYASLARLPSSELGQLGMGKTGAEWEQIIAKNSQLRAPKLNEFADRFRSGTKYTKVQLDHPQAGYEVYKTYSKNLFTRALQKYAYEKPLSQVSKVSLRVGKKESLTSEELAAGKVAKRSFQLNPLGADSPFYDYTMKARANRATQMDESQRAAATAETLHKQFRLLKKTHKEILKRGLGKAEAQAAHDYAWGELVKATDKMMSDLSVKIPRGVAEDIVDPHNFPFEYRKETRKLVFEGSRQNLFKGLGFRGKLTSGKKFVQPPKDWAVGQDLQEATKKLGARYAGPDTTTKLVSEAAVNKYGQVELIRTGSTKGIWAAASDEAIRTSKTIALMGSQPVKAWKYAVLSLSPRYFVNNLSNYLMYAMSANPVATTRGMIDAIRQSKGPKAAAEAEHDINKWIDHQIEQYTGGENGWYQTYYAGIHATTYGSGVESGKFAKGVGLGFIAVEKGIYGPSMRMGTMTALRSVPKVRALERMYRDQGMTDVEAFNAAARRASADRSIHQLVNASVGDWAGQYYHLNGLEQKIMAIVPFYNWDRHALRFAKNLVVKHPTTSAVLGMAGVQGNDYTEKQLGKLPDFMKTAVPIPQLPGIAGKIEDVVLGAQQSGREHVYLTHGINPLAAAGDTVHAVAALGGAYQGREALASQANPLISGVFEGITGENIMTGAKANKKFLGIGGPVGGAAHNIFMTPAPAKMLAPILHQAGGLAGMSGGWGTPKPKPNARTGVTRPFLYSKSEAQNIRNWLGINVRDFDRQAAEALYNEQNHIKKPPSDDRKFLSTLVGNKTTGNSGFKVRKQYTRRARKVTARTHISFPKPKKKGLAGISGIGGI